MGGFAGIGGGKGTTTGATAALEDQSQKLFELARPILETGAAQFEEILRSGGAGALLPSVSRAVEGARSAASSSVSQAEELLAQRGITGTEAGNILANLVQQGELAVAGIEPGFTLPAQQSALAAILGTPQIAIGGLGSAAGAQSGVRAAEVSAQGQILAALAGGLGQGLGAAGAAT